MKLKCFIDGDQLCIVPDNFTNLQEFLAVFIPRESETGRAIEKMLHLMTIEEKLRVMLIVDGIPTEQVSHVIERTKKHENTKAMTGRWHHNLEDYLPSVMLGLHLTAREVAKQKTAASDPPPS